MANLSIPQTSGIYIITCIANEKIYIGSSKNIHNRLMQHRSALKHNKHNNKHLQNTWNKYGAGAFIFEVLELVMPWSVIDREQYWLDTLKPYDKTIGFNVATCARASRLGSKISDEHREKIRLANLGNQHTPESKENMRRSREGKPKRIFTEKGLKNIGDINRGKKLSPELCAKISARNKGFQHTPEQLEKIRIASQKRKGVKRSPEICAKISAGKGSSYIVTNPNGEEIIVVNLSKFCRENDLSYASMTCVAYGKYENHKGWKCRKP